MNAVQWLVQTESLGTTVARLVGWCLTALSAQKGYNYHAIGE